ncbi:MAG: hypothetical protein HRF50_18265 [Phycisphaerae bacterium]
MPIAVVTGVAHIEPKLARQVVAAIRKDERFASSFAVKGLLGHFGDMSKLIQRTNADGVGMAGTRPVMTEAVTTFATTMTPA